MKFLDFLYNLKNKQLSRESKELIFSRFEAKKRQGLFLKKVAMYMRAGVLAMCVFGIFAVVYFSGFGGQTGEWELHEGFIGYNVDENTAVVYADDIGEILTATGEVTITNNGETKSGSGLAHADKVLLLSGAEVVFSMEGGVQAKISGPAEFSLELEEKTGAYVINMLSGEFVEITSVEDENTSLTDREFVADAPNPTPVQESIQLVLKTPEFEISSDTSLGDIDLTISEKDGKPLVENTGIDVVITKIIKDETVITELKSQQTAAINGEVLIAMITPDVEINEAQAEALVENIKNNDLTISYKIEQSDTLEEEIEDSKEESLPSDSEEKTGDEELVKPDAGAEAELVSGKRVIGGEDLALLQQATHASVLMRDVRNIVASYAYGYQPGVQTSLFNLAASLGPVTQNILGGMTLRTDSLPGMIGSLESLILNLEAKWYIPPVYINRLKSTIARLRLVQTVPAGSAEASCDFECIATDILDIQPHQRARLMLQ